MFLASGYLWRAMNAKTPSRFVTFFALCGSADCESSIVLVPCASSPREGASITADFLSYLGLIYAGILGQAIIAGDPLTFDAPPGFVPPWQTQVTNSFVFLAIFALINLLPTLIIFVAARALVPQTSVAITLCDDYLPIAVRVYPDLKATPERKAPRIDGMLVFDCETRVDKTQALTFGSYRFLVAGRCLEEGLFYVGRSDRGRARGAAALCPRASPPTPIPAVFPSEASPAIQSSSCCLITDFRTLLYRVAYKGRGLLCAFNFPFDISRVALGFVPSRDRFLGGLHVPVLPIS